MSSSFFSQNQIEEILKALEGLKYGSVLITVHDAHIVQIDRTEKRRLPLGSADSSPKRAAKGRQK